MMRPAPALLALARVVRPRLVRLMPGFGVLALAACAGGETGVAPADAPTPAVVDQSTSYVNFGGEPGEPCHWRRTYSRVEYSDGRVIGGHSSLFGPPWNQQVSRDSVPWDRFWTEEQPAGYSGESEDLLWVSSGRFPPTRWSG